jgi:cytosine/creatinine deaminase
MLVLSRQRDQAIMIGDEIEVSVVDIRGDKVRLGINAPRSVTVHRKEIYNSIREENESAGQIKPEDVSSLVTSPQNPPLKLVTDTPLDDAALMRAAIDEARKSLSHAGIPAGAVLARNGKIIGRGHDRRIQRGDPLAFSVLDAISNAARQKTYVDTTLYTTLMPPLVCAGAILQLGISRIVVGDTINLVGNGCKEVTSDQLIHNCGVEMVDMHDQPCIDMMAQFLQSRGDRSKEDAGG